MPPIWPGWAPLGAARGEGGRDGGGAEGAVGCLGGGRSLEARSQLTVCLDAPARAAVARRLQCRRCASGGRAAAPRRLRPPPVLRGAARRGVGGRGAPAGEAPARPAERGARRRGRSLGVPEGEAVAASAHAVWTVWTRSRSSCQAADHHRPSTNRACACQIGRAKGPPSLYPFTGLMDGIPSRIGTKARRRGAGSRLGPSLGYSIGSSHGRHGNASVGT